MLKFLHDLFNLRKQKTPLEAALFYLAFLAIYGLVTFAADQVAVPTPMTPVF